MSGTLYVVATPIGNLEDITFRAVRVLREVAVVAAEDTRRTARLLQHYSISTQTTSLHAHNERARIPVLLGRLHAGASVALVSDAGTPVLSDPGALLIAAAHDAGIRVEPIPGPSAALALVSASGFPADEVLFLGFPPSRSKDRAAWFEQLRHEPRTVVFYEAPHRIRASLQQLEEVIGHRPVAIGRELTKVHESLAVRLINDHLEALGEPRGEFTIAIAPARSGSQEGPQIPDTHALHSEFLQMTETMESRKDTIRALARKYHTPVRTMYALVEAAANAVGPED